MVLRVCFWCLLLCIILPISADTFQDGDAYDSKPNCRTLICEQAHEQAKGLSKLALLDEFVSQTVFLLNDLMQNIDGELEKSANSLLRYIHPHCDTTREILQEVIEKQKDKVPRATNDLSGNISPATPGEDGDMGAVFERDYGEGQEDEQESDHFSQWQDSSEISQNPSNEFDTFDHVSSGSGNSRVQTNAHSGGVHDSRPNSKFARDWKTEKSKFGERGTKHSWKPSTPQGKDEDEDQSSESTTQQGSKWRGSGEYESSGDKSSGWVGQHSQRAEGGKSFGFSPGKNNKAKCRGVNKGSAFWVPNLDQWCVENCSRGYCPKTHCVC